MDKDEVIKKLKEDIAAKDGAIKKRPNRLMPKLLSCVGMSTNSCLQSGNRLPRFLVDNSVLLEGESDDQKT